jgi:hypothetical protein
MPLAASVPPASSLARRSSFASLYESPVLAARDEIHGTDDWRHIELRPAIARRAPPMHARRENRRG